ncbi:MAG: efflux RND transporter periplasmic adaptor subunit [Flavobacteriales bacterium]|nr:efflux RND transporter periplasmic adaptor subunit [Flavobacteriales bacterium]MDG1781724.1 efflux RND transporter periplasmic adaptor subunit [Flavobacteriales bacterium]MDG2245713.1 efflux RND transporter periplasmic adaptor subunit [Flavobacteriales bacterium]
MNKGCLTAIIIFTVLVVAIALGTLWYLNDKENQGPETYDTEAPELRDIVLKTVANGSVQPRKEVEIKPQISGIISEILVEAGDIVKEGDLIAKVKVIPNMVSLSNAENRLERARISVDNANMDYDRNAELLDKGVIAPADFQQFETARRQAMEEMNAAEDNLQIVKKGVAKRSGGSSLTNIRATIGGMVLDVPIKEGNSVIEANNFNDGTTIGTIAEMDDLIFIGKLDESEVEKLSIGMELILTIGAIADETFSAELEYISPKGVEENGAIQFEIKAAVKIESEAFIRAGYSANADVVIDKRDQVLSIPEGLIQTEGEERFVEVLVGENEYERRSLELGLSNGIHVEILGGISESDQVKLWNKPIYQ